MQNARQQILYRFELVDGLKVMDTFNFIISPQQAQYTGSYRDVIYKTFDRGTKVDIQGADNDVIRLQGTFSGKRVRTGWSPRAGALTASGALKYFRDNIWKYTDNPRYSTRWQDMRVKLYDIELEDVRFIHINRVQFSRDKSRPFWWNFSIDMTEVPPEDPIIPNALQKSLKLFTKELQGVIDSFAIVTTAITDLTAEARSYADTAFGFSDAVVDTMNVILSDVESTVNDVLTLPGDIAERLNESITRFRVTSDIIATFVAEDIGLLNEYGAYVTSLWDGLKDTIDTTIVQFENAVTKETLRSVYANAFVNPKDPNNTNRPLPPRGRRASAITGNPSAQTIDDDVEIGIDRGIESTFLFDRIEEKTVVNDSTVNELSVQYYGDDSMVPILLELNKLETSFVPAGSIIKIPVTADQNVVEGNLIISPAPDSFGSDIDLNVKGEFIPSSGGDLGTVAGIENISHIVSNIYQIDVGSLVSDPLFGFSKKDIISSAGTLGVFKIVELKMKEAILNDPRISQVVNFKYKIDEDVIRTSGTVILHNGLTKPFSLTL